MILSNEGIQKALQTGALEIAPQPRPEQYTTSAVDLFLGDEFHVWDKGRLAVPGARVELNLAEQQFTKTAEAYLTRVPKERDGSVIFPPYIVEPVHLLAITRERVHLKHESRLTARVEGRSSFARLGMIVHLTAPTVHSGWNGHITLEMINFGPFYLKLIPNRTIICQLIVERLESKAAGDIATEFQGQTKPSGHKRKPRNR